MFCQKCGNQVADNAMFCPKCGAPIAGDNSVRQTSVEPKKKSKKLFFVLAGIVVVVVLAIIIALNWDDKVDYVLTVKAHRPFVSQGFSYTYGTVLDDYIDSPTWEARNENDMINVNIRGKVKSTGSAMLVSINVTPNPNNPDMVSISPASVTVDNVRTNTRNEAVE